MVLLLRRATRDDLALLQRWDREPHVIAADPNGDWQWETELGVESAWREQLIAELHGRPVGYLEILDAGRDPERYWGASGNESAAIDIWIGEPDALGQGHGTTMMRTALARCFARAHVRRVLVDPLAGNLRAHRFYERCGFERVGARQLGGEDCIVYQVRRERWQAPRDEFGSF